MIGLISGIILGILQMTFLDGGVSFILLAGLLGLLIGFLNTKQSGLGLLPLATLAGAGFYVLIAYQSGLWLDDIATGAITGLLIGLIIKAINRFSRNV